MLKGTHGNGVFGIRYVICYSASQISKIKVTLRAQIMLAYYHPWSITLQSCGIARARQRQDPLLFEYVDNPDVSSSMVPSARSAKLRCPPQCFLRPRCLPFSAGRQALIVSPDVTLLASLRSSTCFVRIYPFIKARFGAYLSLIVTILD